MNNICLKSNISQRRACKILNVWRSSQRYNAKTADDEEVLIKAISKLALKYGRYGYRRITALLKMQGWQVNHKRVERIWRLEGLKVAQKQTKKRRFWLNDGSCIRLRPQYPNHVWSYDFVFERTTNGRQIKILNIIISPQAAAVLLLLFSAAMGIATFVEDAYDIPVKIALIPPVKAVACSLS